MPKSDVRFLLYHKQATSARTLFLRFANGSALAPEPLPFLSTPAEEGSAATGAIHPAALALKLAESLGIAPDIVQVAPEYRERVETPDGVVEIHLARFTTIDPPRALFEESGGAFRAITELRGGHIGIGRQQLFQLA
jgi:hypothetical protein